MFYILQLARQYTKEIKIYAYIKFQFMSIFNLLCITHPMCDKMSQSD